MLFFLFQSQGLNSLKVFPLVIPKVEVLINHFEKELLCKFLDYRSQKQKIELVKISIIKGRIEQYEVCVHKFEDKNFVYEGLFIAVCILVILQFYEIKYQKLIEIVDNGNRHTIDGSSYKTHNCDSKFEIRVLRTVVIFEPSSQKENYNAQTNEYNKYWERSYHEPIES